MIVDVDDWHFYVFAGMNRATVFALAQILVAVELLKQRRQVAHNALQFYFRAMQQLMTVLAIPFESIQRALGARHLHHHADAARLPLRRMPHVLRQQKDLALFDRNLERRLARSLHDAKKNVALQLVEKFFGRIVVIIAPLVGTSDHGHHHLAVLPHLRISHGRFEFFFVLFDPGLKVERLEVLDGRHRNSYFSGLYAIARISISKCGCGNW